MYQRNPESIITGIAKLASMFGVFKVISYLLQLMHFKLFLKDCERQIQLEKIYKRRSTNLLMKKSLTDINKDGTFSINRLYTNNSIKSKKSEDEDFEIDSEYDRRNDTMIDEELLTMSESGEWKVKERYKIDFANCTFKELFSIETFHYLINKVNVLDKEN